MPRRAMLAGVMHLVAQSVRTPKYLWAILFWMGLALLSRVLYVNILHAPFFFDDINNIRQNGHIRLTTLSADGLFKAAFYSNAPNRPVANISFALNYYVHQYRVRGYHIVNIL